MKLLKNPVIAVLLAVIIVLSSTFLSARIKLEKASDKITDGFYQGVVYNGYKRKSISSQLKNYSGAVSGLVSIANNYGIATEEASALNGELLSSLSEAQSDISSIYRYYSSLDTAVSALERELSDAELNERDAEGVKQYTGTIDGANSVIAESGYNESVYKYTSGRGALEKFFATLTGTQLPEVFG